MLREYLSTPRIRLRIQRFGYIFLTLIATATLIPILAIVVHIFIEGFSTITWDFLTGYPRDGMRAGGIFPAIIGTLF